MLNKIKTKVNTWLVYKVLFDCKIILETIVEHFIDKKLGIETSNFTSFNNVQSTFMSGLNNDGIFYQAISYKKLRKLVEYLQLDENDIFIDIGAGKGRSIFFIAQYKLRKVIGIELMKELADIARWNLAHLKGNHCPIEIVEDDAATADLSEGTIYFMNNPFGSLTMTNVLNNIRNSLRTNPRKIRIIYFFSVHVDLFLEQDWLEKEGNLSYSTDTIWRNKQYQK